MSHARKLRRASQVRDPNGTPLEVRLLQILDRDELGRPRNARILYDQQTVGEVADGGDKLECLMVWMAVGDLKEPS